MLTTVVTPTAHSTARVMRDMSWMKMDRSAMVCITGLLEAPQGWSGSHTEAEKNIDIISSHQKRSGSNLSPICCW